MRNFANVRWHACRSGIRAQAASHLVVLAMMNLHGSRVNAGLQSRIIIGKLRDGESHDAVWPQVTCKGSGADSRSGTCGLLLVCKCGTRVLSLRGNATYAMKSGYATHYEQIEGDSRLLMHELL